MKYGSLHDKFDYSADGPSNGYQPCYHFGRPDGIRDRNSVNHAAIAAANQELNQQGGCATRDFELGFQQAFLDIANGGSGALPAIPPPRYWAAPYRTTWGHNKARDWFEGYQAGASSAKCDALQEAQTVPTSVYRINGKQLAVGIDGAGNFESSTTAPAVGSWGQTGMSPPGMSSPGMAQPTMSSQSPYGNYLVTPYPANPNFANPYSGATSSPMSSPYSPTQPPYSPTPSPYSLMPPTQGMQPTFVPTQAMPQAPVMPTPPMNYSPQSPTGSPWQSLMQPTQPLGAPAPVLPSPYAQWPSNPGSSVMPGPPPASGGHSIAPGMSPPPAGPVQNTLPSHNPWSRFSDFGPSGFRSEGASR